jgi:hypothetical protein
MHIDPKREPAKMPTSDLTRSRADAFLLIARDGAREPLLGKRAGSAPDAGSARRADNVVRSRFSATRLFRV